MNAADRRAVRTATAAISVVARAGGWPIPATVDLRPAQVDQTLLAAAQRRWEDLARRDLPAGPAAIGVLYEALLAPEARETGVHYTPADVARRLVTLAVDQLGRTTSEPVRVWDPTCGGGAFLLAAADVLVAAGHPAPAVLGGLWGSDLDPGAVAVTRAALAWWAERAGAGAHLVSAQVVRADSLLEPPPFGDTGMDLVVGNPPFQGQLTGRSVRTPERAAALRSRWGDLVGPYTDTSALFLVAGMRALSPGGRLVMVQPTSVLSARDAAACRAAVLTEGELVGLWVAVEPVFDAEVQVCAPVICRRRGDASTSLRSAHRSEEGGASTSLRSAHRSQQVARWRGRSVDPVVAAPPLIDPGSTWAALALAPMGVPDVSYRSDGVLGEVAEMSAGFRDEYYGLVGHVIEAPDGVDPDDDSWPSHLAPLVTSGLVETGWTAWGRRSTSFGRQRFARPAVDLRSLAGDAGRAHRWATANRVPKVVIATQTRVGEAAVDERGRWVASTPTIVASAPVELLWLVAAVVCSPVGTIAAMAATAGSARSPLAIKHSVASASRLPLPLDRAAWEAGADALRDGDRSAFLRAMAAAYEVVDPEPADEWWVERAPWRPR